MRTSQSSRPDAGEGRRSRPRLSPQHKLSSTEPMPLTRPSTTQLDCGVRRPNFGSGRPDRRARARLDRDAARGDVVRSMRAPRARRHPKPRARRQSARRRHGRPAPLRALAAAFCFGGFGRSRAGGAATSSGARRRSGRSSRAPVVRLRAAPGRQAVEVRGDDAPQRVLDRVRRAAGRGVADGPGRRRRDAERPAAGGAEARVRRRMRARRPGPSSPPTRRGRGRSPRSEGRRAPTAAPRAAWPGRVVERPRRRAVPQRAAVAAAARQDFRHVVAFSATMR